MKFCTVINCMDGRVQEQVIEFLKQYYSVEYVDSITEPGPVGILAAGTDELILDSIINKLDISINIHNSVGIALVAHHDCAGNPVPKAQQMKELEQSAELILKLYPQQPLIKLWVDDQWKVNPV